MFPISTRHHMLLGVQDLERHDATTVPRSTNTIVDGHQQCHFNLLSLFNQ